MAELTLCTALLDLGRHDTGSGLSAEQRRDFNEYLTHLDRLLALDAPLVIFTSPDIGEYVRQRRDSRNTKVLALSPAWLEQEFPWFDTVQALRRDPRWRAQAGWLAGSPQAALAHYNPLVMSKMALLARCAGDNPFATDSVVWIDAGIARTCAGVMDQPAWLGRLPALLQRFLFLTYPYTGGSEIHGFPRDAMARWSNTDDVRWVARGGLFGGPCAEVAEINGVYQSLLGETLEAGYMGTEESVFTLMAHREPQRFSRFELNPDGLIGPFIQRLNEGEIDLTETVSVEAAPRPSVSPPPPLPGPVRLPRARLATHASGAKGPSSSNTLNVYVLTFNCPRQLELVLRSWRQDLQALSDSTLYVLDNSNTPAAVSDTARVCETFGAVHMAHGNLGVCGGRQFIAEHFARSGAGHMLFLEDDMLRHTGGGQCRSGFTREVRDLLPGALRILVAERLDFIKLSFSEFFGSNDRQWAWHNVTEAYRKAHWPHHPKRSPGLALDEIPPTRFTRIGSLDGVPYATGEVFYSNWPQIVSRAGNRRMFLETRWAHPFEQTWMAYMYERTRVGEMRAGVLLASPIEHCRRYHYPAEERRES